MSFRHDNSFIGAKTMTLDAENLAPQVLLVDDDKSIRNCISYLLRANGYRVLEAKDGLAAQNILKTEHPALVVSDLQMPICDGWRLLAHCHAEYPNLPVLLTSGDGFGKQPEIERWASGFLPKPFAVSELNAQIQRLIFQAA